MDDMVIDVTGPSREIAYTNKIAGVFYTETNAQHRSAWQGWRIYGKEVMEDYRITFDGKELKRSDVVRTRVYPHQFIREYKNGIIEKVTLADTVNAIIIELNNVPGKNVSIEPLFSGIHRPEEYYIRTNGGIMVIAREDHRTTTPEEQYPGWIAVAVSPGRIYSLPFYFPNQYGKNFSRAYLESVVPSKEYAMVITAGDSGNQAFGVAEKLIDNYPDNLDNRKARFERLLNDSYFRTDNRQLDLAVNWAKVSMDALIMHQGQKGIFAGLPWFDTYRGRDTHISLPGATLVTGNFADAKTILRTFVSWQDTDATSTSYGRIPNQVTTNAISYNTADGTPRFTIALQEYLDYSGDTAFAHEMYPVVKRAVEGTIKYHTDTLGFLTHGDAETWMDAVGPNGPWSPRGNRANDVQALWYKQLRAATSLADFVNAKGSENASIDRWSKLAEKVMKNFQKYFIDPQSHLVYDHLNVDGTPDRQLRPNQLFTFDLIQDRTIRAQVLKTVTEQLVYSHGTASLSQDDDNFHPYHHDMPFYVQDAAYHNGVVWTWLAGEWIDQATTGGMSDLAFQVTLNMARQMLDRGAVGTLSELIDAAPRTGGTEPQLSGAYSQASSLAEFIRSIYQSYLGAKVSGMGSTLSLDPRVPSMIRFADFNVPVGSTTVQVQYRRAGDSLVVNMSSPKNGKEIGVECTSSPESVTQRISSGKTTLAPNSQITLLLDKNGIVQQHGQGEKKNPTETVIGRIDASVLAGVQLATPVVRPDLKSLKGPDHPLLKNDEIKQPASSATLLYSVGDPVGDDKGTGSYTYPKISLLKPGSLDITHFTVSADEKNVYFTLVFDTLSDPEWHPEYGFQLTYAAIAIDKDKRSGSGQTKVGMNAHYAFKKDFAFENIIYVGGGIEIDDAQGNILAEYIPVPGDEANPLGSTQTKTVEFSLPVSLIGKPRPVWRYAVLIGAQDDHGGAGIGEFRNVGATASSLVGGGKTKPTDPNVYDAILPSKSK